MPRGHADNAYRGRGFRGGSQNRGSPARGQGNTSGRGRGRGRGRGTFPYTNEIDFPIQLWPEDSPNRGLPHVRGRGGSLHTSPGYATPRGRGRGRGGGRGFQDANQTPRGRGRGGSKVPRGAPLSKLLYEERPFLKPIVFVRSVLSRTLFEEESEILKPIVEDVADAEESHVPTADRVSRVFSGVGLQQQTDSESEDDGNSPDEDLDEIDFNDMARFSEVIGGTGASDPPAAVPATIEEEVAAIEKEVSEVEDKFTGFFIDTTPTQPQDLKSNEQVAVDYSRGTTLLGQDSDEEIIVYVPPHPRSSKVTPAPPAPPPLINPLPSTSVLTGTSYAPTSTDSNLTASSSTLKVEAIPTPPAPAFTSVAFSFASPPKPQKAQLRHAPVFSVGARAKAQLRTRRKDVRAAKKRKERRAMFGSFGAILSEAQLRGEDGGKDPRWEERRRGDSDVDWGDEGANEADETSGGGGGMDLDPDLDLDVDTMKGFVHGMSMDGSRHVTMDDVADEQMMRVEDAEDEEGTSGTSDENESDEEDELFREEAIMLGEIDDDAMMSQDEGVDEESSDGDGESPRAGFKARLERLRSNSWKRPVDNSPPSDSSDEDEDEDRGFFKCSWARKDDDFISAIEDMLDENEDILSSSNRKERNRLFRAVQNGAFDDLDDFISPSKNRGAANIPPYLLEQWEKDRAKKAEYKRERDSARVEAAADPLTQKKGGKKGRKAMLAAANLDASVHVEHRIVDIPSLEQQIRRFLRDLGGVRIMALPPMDKYDRKQVHEMANAFGLKSQSKGSGRRRYTTLIKTTRSGVNVNEQKVRRLVGQAERGFTGPPENRQRGKGKTVMPRHKDGDEVGKAAPKIGAANVGFRMLSSMGWAEGERIGASGGLDVPLTAVIKNTKLGLGAAVR